MWNRKAAKWARLRVPEKLIDSIRAAHVSASRHRWRQVDFLLRDYAYFLADPVWLLDRLDRLVELHGREPSTAGASWWRSASGRSWLVRCWPSTTIRRISSRCSAISPDLMLRMPSHCRT